MATATLCDGHDSEMALLTLPRLKINPKGTRWQQSDQPTADAGTLLDKANLPDDPQTTKQMKEHDILLYCHD